MARIPEEAVKRIEAEVSVVRLAELAGVELHPDGDELSGPCPFHPDDSSSLRVSPQENAWRCTGECEGGGSAIEWTMRAEGVSFPHAVELLRDGVVPSTPRSQHTKRSTVSKLPSLLPQGAGERELLERVVDFYAQTLHESPEALAYLERRALMVREGKGRKDRMIPTGERPAVWCERYLAEGRPELAPEPDNGVLLLTVTGLKIHIENLSRLIASYVRDSGIGKPGSCHLFRHTMATLMLEGGADIRYVQQMLGHADISSTQIYTRVSLRALEAVHSATHPGASNEPGSARGVAEEDAGEPGEQAPAT